MLISPTGNTSDHPGIFRSERGKKIRNGMVIGLLLAVLFAILSNMVSGGGSSTTSQVDENGVPTVAVVKKDPEWAVMPHDAFSVNRTASLPNGFSGSDAYTSMIASATNTSIQVSTYSSRQSPEDYVAGIQNLSDDARARALAAATKSWPELVDADVNVKGSASGVDPVIRSYDSETMTGTLEIVAKQSVTNNDGTRSDGTRSYLVYVQGTEQEDNTVTWVVTGYQAR